MITLNYTTTSAYVYTTLDEIQQVVRWCAARGMPVDTVNLTIHEETTPAQP